VRSPLTRREGVTRARVALVTVVASIAPVVHVGSCSTQKLISATGAEELVVAGVPEQDVATAGSAQDLDAGELVVAATRHRAAAEVADDAVVELRVPDAVIARASIEHVGTP
jgi:hypothetical protein